MRKWTQSVEIYSALVSKLEMGKSLCVDLPLNVLKKKRLFVETYHFLTLSIACITRLMSSLARDLVSARTALDIILK